MKDFKGMLYSFDMNDPEAKPKPVSYENFNDTGFNPHGIDLYIHPKTQEISLFVINHGAGINTIEIFHVNPENIVLKHIKTIFDEKLISPNDVLATGMCGLLSLMARFLLNQGIFLKKTTTGRGGGGEEGKSKY